MLPDTDPKLPKRRLLKRALYGLMGMRDAFMIMRGKHTPHLSFKVLGDPPSIYINFPIRKEMEQQFADYINLGDNLKPAPIQILEDDEPELMLTLNIYEVSGLVNGPRAEWSTYINDKNGVPRYMVLEARAAAGSLDPVNMFTKPDRVEHQVTDGRIVSTAASQGGSLFTSSIGIDEAQPIARTTAQWTEANDYIYWRNGICDRTSYNASVFDGKARCAPAEDFTISDETHWVPFIEKQPRHAIRYENALELVVAPWFNI